MAPRHRTTTHVLGLAALVGLAACGTARPVPAPPADLIVATSDSSFWITSDRKGLRMRGVPLVVARVNGRFEELYVADDDRSYFDAVFVGQRLYMRDLIRGDSVQLMADSLVPRLAKEYASANPHEERLRPGEDASDHPGTTATADLEIVGVHGPYLSYEYRTDVDVTGGRQTVDRHSARRGVIDLRTGKAVSLAAIAGRETAGRAIRAAQEEWSAGRDSLLGRDDARSRSAQRTAQGYAFDSSSFSLDASDRQPQVVFAVPGATSGGNSGALNLTPRALGSPAWWAAAIDEFPAGPDSALSWTQGRLSVLARSVADADRDRIVLRDSRAREWAVGTVASPVERVLWLEPSIGNDARRALHRAFNDAAQYSDDGRIAAAPPSSKSAHASRLVARAQFQARPPFTARFATSRPRRPPPAARRQAF